MHVYATAPSIYHLAVQHFATRTRTRTYENRLGVVQLADVGREGAEGLGVHVIIVAAGAVVRVTDLRAAVRVGRVEVQVVVLRVGLLVRRRARHMLLEFAVVRLALGGGPLARHEVARGHGRGWLGRAVRRRRREHDVRAHRASCVLCGCEEISLCDTGVGAGAWTDGRSWWCVQLEPLELVQPVLRRLLFLVLMQTTATNTPANFAQSPELVFVRERPWRRSRKEQDTTEMSVKQAICCKNKHFTLPAFHSTMYWRWDCFCSIMNEEFLE